MCGQFSIRLNLLSQNCYDNVINSFLFFLISVELVVIIATELSSLCAIQDLVLDQSSVVDDAGITCLFPNVSN
ncbi:hypothetical protein BpHYR1_011572 [Brachionus plicatilis]|uniref:Uncharacterized protein n=1 Tax=Brachionus plicatilis TaxID=10195 RepID=A0A3M7PCP3_BRAPC|nr:hypothetical protein BpHYR1_011572 [Brachionus plicatilis]